MVTPAAGAGKDTRAVDPLSACDGDPGNEPSFRPSAQHQRCVAAELKRASRRNHVGIRDPDQLVGAIVSADWGRETPLVVKANTQHMGSPTTIDGRADLMTS